MTRPEDALDYKSPNYDDIVMARVERLHWLRSGTVEEQGQRLAEL